MSDNVVIESTGKPSGNWGKKILEGGLELVCNLDAIGMGVGVVAGVGLAGMAGWSLGDSASTYYDLGETAEAITKTVSTIGIAGISSPITIPLGAIAGLYTGAAAKIAVLWPLSKILENSPDYRS